MTAALTIEAVSKAFRVRRNRPTTLREGFVQWLSGRHGATDTVVALRDVSFTVRRGAVSYTHLTLPTILRV